MNLFHGKHSDLFTAVSLLHATRWSRRIQGLKLGCFTSLYVLPDRLGYCVRKCMHAFTSTRFYHKVIIPFSVFAQVQFVCLALLGLVISK